MAMAELSSFSKELPQELSKELPKGFPKGLSIGKWALSQILPYQSANSGPTGGISAARCLKIPDCPLTVAARSREIVNQLI
jgi:hypothetical protein